MKPIVILESYNFLFRKTQVRVTEAATSIHWRGETSCYDSQCTPYGVYVFWLKPYHPNVSVFVRSRIVINVALPFSCVICIWNCYFCRHLKIYKDSVSMVQACPLLLDIRKVKLSHYRPGQALKVPGSRGSPISIYSAYEGGKVVSLTHWPPLHPGNIPGIYFC